MEDSDFTIKKTEYKSGKIEYTPRYKNLPIMKNGSCYRIVDLLGFCNTIICDSIEEAKREIENFKIDTRKTELEEEQNKIIKTEIISL